MAPSQRHPRRAVRLPPTVALPVAQRHRLASGPILLGSALRIAGSDNIVTGAVDSDGSDGPGRQFWKGDDGVPQLARGVVARLTAARADELGIDIAAELSRHNCRLHHF